jgi:hypothetical protein
MVTRAHRIGEGDSSDDLYTEGREQGKEVAIMATTRTMKAALRHENGHQVIVLPDAIQFDGDEVMVRQDTDTGEVTVESRTASRRRREEMFAYIDSLPIPQEDIDAFMSERPMNVAVEPRNVLEDDE